MRVVNATVLAAVFFSLLQNPEAESAELARAREDVKKATAAVATAEAKLVNVYEAFEGWVARAAADPPAPKVAQATRDAINAVRRDIATGVLTADPAQRTQTTTALRTYLVRQLDPLLGSDFAGAIGGKIANNLFNITISQSDPGEVIAKVISDAAARWFDTTVPAHELWNRDLFREIPAAKAYAEARTAHAAAMERVARIEHPERFHPAYASTPEGMVLVPGGTFTLGPDDGYDIDTKKRSVAFPINIKTFYLDKTEVTNRQYYEFLKSLSKADAATRAPSTWKKDKNGVARIPEGREQHPVTNIGYEDAAAYATFAKKRLPTEDEWEAAARGMKGFQYPFGVRYEPGKCNDLNGDARDVAPVGAHPADISPFGALDMAGNVMEWTSTQEGGKAAPLKLEGATGIVIRGGAYDREPRKCSAVYRWVWAGTTRVGNLGFRCAKDAF